MPYRLLGTATAAPPQWSPVVMTGRTERPDLSPWGRTIAAAMEPGRDDREDVRGLLSAEAHSDLAAMEPGRDDREDDAGRRVPRAAAESRNGARS